MSEVSEKGSAVPVRQRLGSEVIKRGYSDEEISHIYELARFSLECGEIKRAELILLGLVEISPDFVPALLGLGYIHIQAKNFEQAIHTVQSALRIEPGNVEGTLFLAALLLTTGDFNSAGTHLGEVGEMIDAGQITDSDLIRFYRAQITRFNNR